MRWPHAKLCPWSGSLQALASLPAGTQAGAGERLPTAHQTIVHGKERLLCIQNLMLTFSLSRAYA